MTCGNQLLAAGLPGQAEPMLPRALRGAFGDSNALSEELEAEKIIVQQN